MNTIAIIGCGVSGLSCGVRLLEAGYAATIYARDLPPHTTSNIAAAIWYPYKAYPEDKVMAWGQHTFDVLTELADQPQTGVGIAETIEVLRQPAPDPWWRACVQQFRRATAAELPAGYVDGYVFSTPVIEMPVYLPWLMQRFQDLGGTIVQRELGTPAEVPPEHSLIVNCTGLGARSLVHDAALFPIRGQIVRVSAPSVQQAWLDEGDADHPAMSYIVPRSHDCILGGTAADHDWNLAPDSAISAAIWERCVALLPELHAAAELEVLVGLRPGRHAVRLDAERLDDGRSVVHNYGHGGAGVTLSWGCAADVVQLVQQMQHH